MIPRIIHYCWLSGDPVPPDYRRCMDTWREKLPGYTFVLWDMARYDAARQGAADTLWVRQALETGLWACAADYIRLYAVYREGGIYLDMDMEALKPFDPLLGAGLMLARENHVSGNLEAGCFGAEPGHPFIRRCMDLIERRPLVDPARMPKVMKLPLTERHDFINPPILPEIMSAALAASPERDAWPVYSRDYFTAKNVVTGRIEATDNTYTIHHFGSKYHSERWYDVRDLKQRIHAVFERHRLFTRMMTLLVSLMSRVDEKGVSGTLRYFVRKLFLRRGPAATI